MMTQEQAKAKLNKVEAQIGEYTNAIAKLTETADLLEEICNDFDSDTAAHEPDRHVASRISFYPQHVTDGAEHLRKMTEWYERRIEFEKRKLHRLRDFLDSNPGTVTANSVDIDDEDTATEKSSDEIADELTAKLQQKICPATWHVHTRLQGDRGYRSLILSKLTVEHDWYDGHGYNFIIRREVLAHYDTAAQVEEVIGRIGAVATFKETEFNFPHVAELTATEYREKLWAVDFDICHEDSDLTEEELRDYTDALSDAMTANGNRAHVELETCVITIYGDSDGDNLTVDKIVAELETRGCRIVENYEEWEVNKAEEDAAE